MSAETIQHLEFYSPSPQYMGESALIDQNEALPQAANKQLEGLKVKLLTPFTANSDDRIKVFTDGNKPFSPVEKGTNKIFTDQCSQVVRRHCAEYFNEEGEFVDESARTAFSNIVEIAPLITKIFTGQDHHISMVQQNQSLNIVDAAIQMAKDPSTTVAIRTGFGGSDDDFTPERLPAYGIPALGMATEIEEMYAQRERIKMKQAAVKKRAKMTADYLGVDSIDRKHRELIAQEVEQIGPENILTEEEQCDIRTKFAIPSQQPTIEFFFAHNAAIAINTVSRRMDPDKIPARTADNIATMQAFVEKYYPQLSSLVEYNTDIPWETQNPTSKVVREYLAKLLRESQDPSVQDTIATLETLGGNHGGDEGAENAAEYAGIHPLVFGDSLDVPTEGYIDNRSKAQINITIGGSTERHFCAIRDFLTKNASYEGLEEFIEQKIEWAENTEEASVLKDIQEQVRFLQNNRPALPSLGISLITDLAHKPVYYATEHDKPLGTGVNHSIVLLKGQEILLSKQKGQEAALQRENLRGVINDLSALRDLQWKRLHNN